VRRADETATQILCGGLDKGGDPAYTLAALALLQGGATFLKDGRLAQLVEQMTLNHRVAGSNPASPTILRSASYGSASQRLLSVARHENLRH
jgi:hypothetical protein